MVCMVVSSPQTKRAGYPELGYIGRGHVRIKHSLVKCLIHAKYLYWCRHLSQTPPIELDLFEIARTSFLIEIIHHSLALAGRSSSTLANW